MKLKLISSVVLILLSLSFSDLLMAIEYKVAVRAHRGIEYAFNGWQSTLDVINKNLPSINLVLIPVISLKEITERTGRAEFDFVLTNPSSFVEIKKLYKARILVTLNNKRANTAQNKFGSVIFTHAKNTDIISIKNLKNKTLMAVSEHAFGGWRVAWLEMLKHNINPYTDLKELIFTKSKTQQEVVFSVLNRKIQVGVVRTDLLERLEADDKIDMRYLRILNNKEVKGFPFFLSTELYPEWAFSALQHISISDELKVKQQLLRIKSDSKAAISGEYIGWIAPEDYSGVAELMKKLNIGPFSK